MRKKVFMYNFADDLGGFACRSPVLANSREGVLRPKDPNSKGAAMSSIPHQV